MKIFKTTNILIMVIFLILQLNQSVFSYTVQDVRSDKDARELAVKIVEVNVLLKDNLEEFISSNGGKKNDNFKKFYKKNRIIFEEPVKNYYSNDNYKISLDLNSNKLIFESSVNINKYKNHRVKSEFSIHIWPVINRTDMEFGITDPGLRAYPEYRALVLREKMVNSLGAYFSGSRISIKNGTIFAKLKLKDRIIRIVSKKNVTPEKISISFKYLKGGRAVTGNNLKTLKNSIEGYLLSFKIPVKRNRAVYSVSATLSPAHNQSRSLGRFSKHLASFKSYRSNTGIKIWKQGKAVFAKNYSGAGVHITDEQARFKSIEKAGKKSGEKILQFIISDLYKIDNK